MADTELLSAVGKLGSKGTSTAAAAGTMSTPIWGYLRRMITTLGGRLPIGWP